MKKNLNKKEYLLWVNELISKGKTVQVKVEGMSMFPFLLGKDVVKIKQVNKKSLKRGDVVLFIRDEQLIAHRILKVNKSSIITRGDGNLKQDYPIEKDKIKGKVISIIKSRTFLAEQSLKYGSIIAIATPVTGPLFYGIGLGIYKIKTHLTNLFRTK
ncbi:signal peptidase I [Marinilabiliaceae bacterium ANBcel2]|nr:signal peptidase I [Marinilabiliaceae bacterium ANBcel2]